MNNPQMHGGLRLPTVLDDVGEAEEAQIHQRWEYYEEVRSYVEEELGVPPPKEPEFACPTLTAEDLNNPNPVEYTTRYNEFNAWYDFLTQVLSHHRAKLLEIDAEMEDISANLRESIRKTDKRTVKKTGETKAPSNAEMEDRILLNPRFIELKQRKLKEAQIISILDAKTTGLYRQVQLLSRQVEIRRQNIEGGNRGTNIQGRGGLPNVRSPSTSGWQGR